MDRIVFIIFVGWAMLFAGSVIWRFIADPYVFAAVVVTSMVMLTVQACYSVMGIRIKQCKFAEKRLLILCGLLLINSAALYFHERFLGIKFVLIPTESMLPTISPGDIVIGDLWQSSYSNLTPGVIILFKRETANGKAIFIKSISAIGYPCKDKSDLSSAGNECQKGNLLEIHVQGDNSSDSYDSRHFDAINSADAVGVATGVIATLDLSGKLSFDRVKQL